MKCNQPTAPKLVGPDLSVAGEPVIYFLRVVDQPFVKVGWATKWKTRCTNLQCGSPFPLEVMLLARGGPDAESAAHTALAIHGGRHRGEWFKLDDNAIGFMQFVKWAEGNVLGVAQLVQRDFQNTIRRRVRASSAGAAA